MFFFVFCDLAKKYFDWNMQPYNFDFLQLIMGDFICIYNPDTDTKTDTDFDTNIKTNTETRLQKLGIGYRFLLHRDTYYN